MVSLIDIVPQKRTVQIAAGELELHGLGLRQIAYLFQHFPSLAKVFTPNAPDVDIVELVLQVPGAVGTIIAEAANQPEAADAIADGNLLSPDEILDCLEAIRDLTFPRGIYPLLGRVEALVLPTVLGPLGRDQVMSAPPRPSSLSQPDMLAAK